VHDFRKLEVYQEAVAWTAHVYRFTAMLPASERWGLTSQIRRCAASVPANIAEGAGRGGDREFARFLRIAIGSLCEFESHLDVSEACDLTTAGATRQLRDRSRTLTKRIKVLERAVAARSSNY
jgi:four helix bundle protein